MEPIDLVSQTASVPYLPKNPISIPGFINIDFEKKSSTPLYDGMVETTKSLDALSTYKTDFNLEVYKSLEIRNNKSPIRGGVTFKTPIKLVNSHSTCKQCHYALEIDAYGRGCVHNCSYCYAKEQLTRYGYWNNPYPVPLDIVELRKLFYIIFETSKPNKWREVLEQRIPFRVGSMSDSFMKMDLKLGITKELLNIFKHYRYPYIIFTRGDIIAEDEYMNAMDRDLASIQMSISSINDNLNKKIEPGAPTAKARLTAMKTLSEAGFWTTVRINPLFLMYPDGYYTDPHFDHANAPHLDFFSWDMIDAIADHKIPTLLAGVVRLNPVALKQFSVSAGLDYSKFFKKESLAMNGDKRFSDNEVAFYYSRIKDLAQKRGVRFSTCYIGNGEKDYFQYQNLWSNKGVCCDAKGNVSSFGKSCQELPEKTRLKFAPQSAKVKIDS